MPCGLKGFQQAKLSANSGFDRFCKENFCGYSLQWGLSRSFARVGFTCNDFQGSRQKEVPKPHERLKFLITAFD